MERVGGIALCCALAGSASGQESGAAAPSERGPKVSERGSEVIRAARAAARAQAGVRRFEVTQHTIRAVVEPDHHSLDVEDVLTLVALVPELQEVSLYTSVVEVDSVEAQGLEGHTTTPGANADLLLLRFTEPLPVGEPVEVQVALHADDFLLEIDQQLVAEIAVLGQVRPGSSFSTHIAWYPMEERNDAAVDLEFEVPAPYVALCGGRLAQSDETSDRHTYRYVTESRVPRILPFGFAVGEYQLGHGRSEGGIEFTVAGFAGDEKRIEQRIDLLQRAAAVFERCMGPLPWKEVGFAHVRPIRKETGVSTPGLIQVSDFYFPDLEHADLSDGDLSRPSSLGLLVVADELSHQWNLYHAQLPNELAEGISTFTNALFVEALHDGEAYAKTIANCRDAWIRTAGREVEYAIADPLVYSNTRYRPVVFCKTPVVLDALRQELGDDVFFAGFRRAISDGEPGVDGFDRLERGLSTESGRDLRPWFDQWFFRAGFPVLEVHTETAGKSVRITMRPVQDGEPYRLRTDAIVRCADGSEQRIEWEVGAEPVVVERSFPAEVTEVVLDPRHCLPAELRPRD